MDEAKLNKAKYIQGEIKSYNYLIKCIEDCNQNLERISTEIQGVSSPVFKEVILENKSNPYHDRKLELMEEETRYVNERDEFIKRLKYVEEKISLLDEVAKGMVVDLWIKEMKVDAVLRKYNYSKSGLYDYIERAIMDIV